MSRRSLTPRPRVPLLVHAAALSLGLAGCGDDGGVETQTSGTTYDDHPTACHNGEPGCDTLPVDSTTTADGSTSGTGTAASTGTGDTGTTGSGSGTGTAGSSGDTGSGSGSGSSSGAG